MKLKELTADEAVALIEDGLTDEIYIMIGEIIRLFGLTDEEAMAELRSGRLVATGVSDGHGGYTEVCVRGDVLLNWMVLTGSKIIKIH